MPVNLRYWPETGFYIWDRWKGDYTVIKELRPHSNTDKIQEGCAYLAFTEYNRTTGVGTVAFKRALDVSAHKYSRNVDGSLHIVHYKMLHPEPLQFNQKIFTGWSIQLDGSLKFNSSSMNSGMNYYHEKCYYNDYFTREALKLEQDLFIRFLETWKQQGQPLTGWVLKLGLEKSSAGKELEKSQQAKREERSDRNSNNNNSNTITKTATMTTTKDEAAATQIKLAPTVTTGVAAVTKVTTATTTTAAAATASTGKKNIAHCNLVTAGVNLTHNSFKGRSPAKFEGRQQNDLKKASSTKTKGRKKTKLGMKRIRREIRRMCYNLRRRKGRRTYNLRPRKRS